VLEDMRVAAIKVGMLGTIENIAAVASIKEDYPDIPMVIDPLQLSGRGQQLAEESLDDALCTLLLPHAELLTPNSREARQLAPEADTLDACAQELMSLGCRHVLITGTHEATPRVVNHFYGNMRLLETYICDRLPGVYHGSGCTLASACAGTLAHGLAPVNAVASALKFTFYTLKHGLRLGMGQLIPDRQYAIREPVQTGTPDDE
jgi:hydroxymethylpyrimidine/phosphomethylpyrimidine kinase